MIHLSPKRLGLVVLSLTLLGCSPGPIAPSAPTPPGPASTVVVQVTASPAVAQESAEPEPEPEQSLARVIVAPSGLEVEELVMGTGAEATVGAQVQVHYVGSLLDGTEFDSTRKRAVPFSFKLGSGMVIPGFEQGVLGMRVGGVRRITIPPELGYGDRGRPPTIPPSSVLVFELELVDVR